MPTTYIIAFASKLKHRNSSLQACTRGIAQSTVVIILVIKVREVAAIGFFAKQQNARGTTMRNKVNEKGVSSIVCCTPTPRRDAEGFCHAHMGRQEIEK